MKVFTQNPHASIDHETPQFHFTVEIENRPKHSVKRLAQGQRCTREHALSWEHEDDLSTLSMSQESHNPPKGLRGPPHANEGVFTGLE